MTEVFSTRTRLQAWLGASRHLLDVSGHAELNLLLSIQEPAATEPGEKVARTLIDSFYLRLGKPPSHAIAEWIFPASNYRRYGLKDMYSAYEADYQALKNVGYRKWGTYAYRLMHRVDAKGGVVNPLDLLILKMKTESRTPGPKRSCYELGIAEGAYDVPLYNTVDDESRHEGGPCLSHLSFKLFQRSVHLTAVYRSHDYGLMTYGNLLGLARLQACVAQEVGLCIGSLVVHSTYAYIRGNIGEFRVLLNDVEEACDKEERHALAQ